MSDDLLRDEGASSEELADLYALKQYIYYSGIGPTTYYLERVEGAFVRPSFWIKYVTMSLTPVNSYMDKMVYSVMVQYFTDDYFDAMKTAGHLTKLFGDKKGIIIPKYDFSCDPPQVFSINGLDSHNDPTPMKMGIRVIPQTVLAAPFQENDENWNVPVTFNAESYRTKPEPNYPIIRRIFDQYGEPLSDTKIVTAEVTTSSDIKEI